MDGVIGMAFGKFPRLPQRQLMQALKKIIAFASV